MNLGKIFSNENNTANLAKTLSQQSPAQTARMNSQIRSLVPGQTLSGEIVGRNGSEVQIKISEDMVLNARVDQNLNIEVGQNMTFQVKANGSALTLSPLFTNVATDVNVLKALEMANLPVNEITVAMTEQLMGAGMSINRNSLLQVYREINQFATADTVAGDKISDIIGLHKLDMPVNEANMSQMESYRNLTHQLVSGMDTIFSELPGVAQHMLANGDAMGAMNLYQELFSMITSDENVFATGGGINGEIAVPQTDVANLNNMATIPEAFAGGQNGNVVNAVMNHTLFGEMLDMGNSVSQAITDDNVQTSYTVGMEGISTNNTADSMILSNSGVSISAEARMALAQDVMQMIEALPLSQEQAENIQTQMQQFMEGQISTKQFFSGMQQLLESVQTSQGNVFGATQSQREVLHNLHKLFAKTEFKNLLLSELKNQWLLTPEEVSEPGKVGELYRKLDSQLNNLAQVLENAGQQESAAFKAVTNMNQNIDFLQQVNQMYTYVQLPLKLQGQNANGELYVYANRKNLAKNDGNISALLHLDMEHLGPVDVYVTMQYSKVNTKFYVRDDDMLDFLAEHMDLLTERLKKRGYDCSFSMTTRENAETETTEGGIESILQQEKGVVLSQYAFDVRT